MVPLKLPNAQMRQEERKRRTAYITERKQERMAISQWMGLARTENRRLLYHSAQIGEYQRRTSFAKETQNMMSKAAVKVSANRKMTLQPAEDTIAVAEKKIQV